jgi:hypothetical protein
MCAVDLSCLRPDKINGASGRSRVSQTQERDIGSSPEGERTGTLDAEVIKESLH